MDRTVYKEELYISYRETMRRAWALAEAHLTDKEMYKLREALGEHSEERTMAVVTIPHFPELAEAWRRAFEISELASYRYGRKIYG